MAIELNIGSEDFRQFETWTKVLPQAPSGPLGLLTQTAFIHLRPGVLLVAYPPSQSPEDVHELTTVVSAAMRRLQSTVFDYLEVYVLTAEKTDQDLLAVDVLDVDPCEKTKMRTMVRDPDLIAPEIQKVLNLLLTLRATNEPSVSGFMEEEFANHLKNAIIRGSSEDEKLMQTL